MMSNSTTVEIFDKLLSIDQNLLKATELLMNEIATIKLVLSVFALCITLVMVMALFNYRKIREIKSEGYNE